MYIYICRTLIRSVGLLSLLQRCSGVAISSSPRRSASALNVPAARLCPGGGEPPRHGALATDPGGRDRGAHEPVAQLRHSRHVTAEVTMLLAGQVYSSL